MDIGEGTAEGLPEGVGYLGVRSEGGVRFASFSVPYREGEPMDDPFDTWAVFDEDGVEHQIWQVSSTIGIQDPVTGKISDRDGLFTVEFPLEGLEGDVFYMDPTWDSETVFPEPVSVKIK